MPSDGDLPHPLFARVYDVLLGHADRHGMAAFRDELVAGLSGRVIEPGAGPGFNFSHYAREVTEVVAVEPEPHFRSLASGRAERAAVPIRVVPGRAESLPAATGEFDAAVVSLVLCSVSDPAAALAELRRVLRPGSPVRFLEHVRAPTGLAHVQRALDATTLWPRLGAGCHVSRNAMSSIEAAGLHVRDYRLFRFVPTLAGGVPNPALLLPGWFLAGTAVSP